MQQSHGLRGPSLTCAGLTVRVCWNADAFETMIEILRVRKAHPDVAPDKYVEVDERFRQFANCELGESGGKGASLAVCTGIVRELSI